MTDRDAVSDEGFADLPPWCEILLATCALSPDIGTRALIGFLPDELQRPARDFERRLSSMPDDRASKYCLEILSDAGFRGLTSILARRGNGSGGGAPEER